MGFKLEFTIGSHSDNFNILHTVSVYSWEQSEASSCELLFQIIVLPCTALQTKLLEGRHNKNNRLERLDGGTPPGLSYITSNSPKCLLLEDIMTSLRSAQFIIISLTMIITIN